MWVIVRIRALGQSGGAGLREGVIAVQHDAVEVEVSSIHANILGVVVAELDDELARPAAAGIGGRCAAALGVGLCGCQAPWVVDQVRADERIFYQCIRTFLLVDQAQHVTCTVEIVSLRRQTLLQRPFTHRTHGSPLERRTRHPYPIAATDY